MAPSKFDDLLAELIESEDISDEVAARIKQASDGSGLRKERDEAVKRAETAEQRATSFRDGAIRSQFAKHELKLNPKALNLPDDLDVTDDKAVKDWLIEAGAITDTDEAEIEAELDQQEKVTAASANGKTARTTGALTPAEVATWSPDKLARFEKEHPEAMDQILQGQEVRGIAF